MGDAARGRPRRSDMVSIALRCSNAVTYSLNRDVFAASNRYAASASLCSCTGLGGRRGGWLAVRADCCARSCGQVLQVCLCKFLETHRNTVQVVHVCLFPCTTFPVRSLLGGEKTLGTLSPLDGGTPSPSLVCLSGLLALYLLLDLCPDLPVVKGRALVWGAQLHGMDGNLLAALSSCAPCRYIRDIPAV